MTIASQGSTATAPIGTRLARHLSSPRLGPYRSVTRNDTEALELYRWNMRVSGELHQMLALVEVGLRNALDAQLRP
jgi:hypothetical protein